MVDTMQKNKPLRGGVPVRTRKQNIKAAPGAENSQIDMASHDVQETSNKNIH